MYCKLNVLRTQHRAVLKQTCGCVRCSAGGNAAASSTAVAMAVATTVASALATALATVPAG